MSRASIAPVRRFCSAIAEASSPKSSSKRRRKPLSPDPYTPPPPPESFPPYEELDCFRFELVHQSSRSAARVGRVHTPHGVIDTPGFVAVATNAALKAVDHRPLGDLLQLIFCNTYHLLLHPGPQVIKEAGGLHSFMQRDRPIITDSGGFQVFSLAHGSVTDELNMKKSRARDESLLLEVSENGATFRSYRDGKRLTLTPESSVDAQKAYGSDIIVPLDELPPYHIDREKLHRSVLLSHRWEARSLRRHLEDRRNQAMYAVVHGGIDEPMRQMSAEYLTSLPFDGYAIGGSLGKDRYELFNLLRFVVPLLPKEKPNHLLGIADVESIQGSVPFGVDTFDSCFPTRLGRHGTLLTKRFGRVQIRQGKWKNVFEPPDWEGGLQGHTLAYLHHLFKAHEPIAATLLTLHNLHFMAEFMESIRAKILNDEI
ncbi:Queuine tRNA-ribosyltransferase [Gracilariopsis chorda]|uniref:Queuine tRNA-ribosyltransferase n=1 Tax=Gracilariopsis chorda TaxID=448386 RepID=A0A2V3J2E4_9FLOR|nr:Queuine tRNA-ribosyltransferase [Gracilariopsis chorda]|eukprot:PXF47570.1 Queuine tRNA-ribosyltransferase [Gracilariopsis chorda]